MRWKYAIPTLVILILVLVFGFFFLDPLLKWAMVAGGQLAFGAKVEISRVKTHIAHLSLDIQGLQVADRQNPMTNLFVINDLRFGVQPLPLLSKKILIDEMRLEGLSWGTARETSGALPPRKQKKIDQRQASNSLMGKFSAKLQAKGKAEMASLPALQSLQDAKNQVQNLSAGKLVNPAELQSLKQMDGIKTQYQQKAADYEQQIKSLDVNAKISAAQPVFNEVANLKIQTTQDALAAKDKLDRARQQLQELQATYDKVNKLKTQVETDFGQTQGVLQQINQLKDQDLQALSAKLKLPTLSYQNVARALVGPVWLGRLHQAIQLIDLGRKYMPNRKPDEKKVVKMRMKGMDVSFPVQSVPPDFLIKQIRVSGTTGGPGKKNQPLEFQGLVTDVTSDPRLWGRPTRAKLKGRQDNRTFGLVAELDHTRDTPKDSLEIALGGLNPAGLNLPSSEYLPNFNQGQVYVLSRIALRGERLEATLHVTLSGLGQATAQTGSAEVKNLIRDLWRGIQAIEVNAKLAGPSDDLQMSVSSNLDSLLADRMKAVAGGKIAELQQKLRSQIDQYTAAKQKEVLNQFSQSKSGVLSRLGADDKQIQDKMNAGQNLIQQKENAAGEAAKKQAEEQLKNKAQEQFKNLNLFK